MNNVPESLQADFRRLSTDNVPTSNNNSSNPNQVYSAMMRAITSSIKTVKMKSVCSLLRRLRKEGVGTNGVESLVRRICTMRSGKHDKNLCKRVKHMVMRSKIDDAFHEYKKQKCENSKVWKQCKEDIPAGPTRDAYNAIWKTFMDNYKRDTSADSEKKIEWLVRRWKHQDDIVPAEYRGIRIKDELTGRDSVSDEFKSDCRIYGNVDLSPNEKTALELSPKFGLYEKLDVTKAMIQTEEALNKLRWSRILGKNRNK